MLTKEVKSWFIGNTVYPLIFECGNLNLLRVLVNHFSKTLNAKSDFTSASVRKEIKKIASLEGIPDSEIEPILITTLVLLHGKTFEIVKGFTATLSLSIDQHERSRDKITGEVKPDGNLSIVVHPLNDTGSDDISASFSLVNTETNSEKYLCRSLVKVDKYGFERIEIPMNLVFERNAEKMVFEA